MINSNNAECKTLVDCICFSPTPFATLQLWSTLASPNGSIDMNRVSLGVV
jgi:hypothetical protein